jgi:hypothetical protein
MSIIDPDRVPATLDEATDLSRRPPGIIGPVKGKRYTADSRNSRTMISL